MRRYVHAPSELMTGALANEFFEVEGTTALRQVTHVGERRLCSLFGPSAEAA